MSDASIPEDSGLDKKLFFTYLEEPKNGNLRI